MRLTTAEVHADPFCDPPSPLEGLPEPLVPIPATTDVATSTKSSAVMALTSSSGSVATGAVATPGTRESFYADLGNPMGWIPSQMSEIPDFLPWVSWFQEELERVKEEARQRLLVAETGEVGNALREIYEQE